MIGHTDQANHQYDLTTSTRRSTPATCRRSASSRRRATRTATPATPIRSTSRHFLVDTINALQQLARLERHRGLHRLRRLRRLVRPRHAADRQPVDDPRGRAHGAGSAATPTRTAGGYQDRCGYGPRLPLLVDLALREAELRRPHDDRPDLDPAVHRGQLEPGPDRRLSRLTRGPARWTACSTSRPPAHEQADPQPGHGRRSCTDTADHEPPGGVRQGSPGGSMSPQHVLGVGPEPGRGGHARVDAVHPKRRPHLAHPAETRVRQLRNGLPRRRLGIGERGGHIVDRPAWEHRQPVNWSSQYCVPHAQPDTRPRAASAPRGSGRGRQTSRTGRRRSIPAAPMPHRMPSTATPSGTRSRSSRRAVGKFPNGTSDWWADRGRRSGT